MSPESSLPTESTLEGPPVRQLTAGQRRVLGTLVEKAITTPNQYPLTLKALTAGCNQSSNRDPVTSYSEDLVGQIIDELRELGLAATVHTEGGRTERFRHYMRNRYPFTEPQLAIVTELLLRGRQQLGELRARASRMASIESLEDLRTELAGLVQQKYVRTSGPLERRGAEVDHSFYPTDEAERLRAWASADAATSESDHSSATSGPGADPSRRDLATTVEALQALQLRLEQQVASLASGLDQLRAEVQALRRDLGN